MKTVYVVKFSDGATLGWEEGITVFADKPTADYFAKQQAENAHSEERNLEALTAKANERGKSVIFLLSDGTRMIPEADFEWVRASLIKRGAWNESIRKATGGQP